MKHVMAILTGAVALAMAGCVSDGRLPPLTDAGYVVGRIADSGRFATNLRLGKAFSFLRRSDLASLPVGRYEIDGEDVFALVQGNRRGQTLRNVRKHGGWRGLRGLRQG